MPEGARQLVLDLPVVPRLGAEDFLIGPSNAQAYAYLSAWPDWPAQLVHLEGPPGSGKSHLASIWAERAGGWIVAARDVRGGREADLLAGGALVLEDLDRGPHDEAALFHLVNGAREGGVFLLATSAVPIDRCGIGTPDLVSRLRLAPSLSLGPPDDALLRGVLVKLFHDRQLAVDASVVEYAAARIERSLASAVALVMALDREALSQGRRVTRPMAASILSDHEGATDIIEPSHGDDSHDGDC